MHLASLRPLFFGNLVVVKWHLKVRVARPLCAPKGPVPFGVRRAFGGSSDELLDEPLPRLDEIRGGLLPRVESGRGDGKLDQSLLPRPRERPGWSRQNRVGQCFLCRDAVPRSRPRAV
jgi:hypothetical protein